MRYLFLLLILTSCARDLPDPEIPPLQAYAASFSNGIYHTTNGGRSWTPLLPDQEEIAHYFKRLHLFGNKLYIATSGAGLFELSGNTLNPIPAFKDMYVTSLATHNNTLYAGTREHGVLALLDNWTPITQGLISPRVNALFTEGKTLYAATEKGVFLLDQEAWEPISNGLQNQNIYSLISFNDTLYAGAGPYLDKKGFFADIPTLYKRQEGAWIPVDDGLPEDTLVYTFAILSGTLYAGTSSGLYVLEDQWEKISDLRPLDIQKVGQNLYLSTTKGVFTGNPDTRWLETAYGLPDTTITSLLFPETS